MNRFLSAALLQDRNGNSIHHNSCSATTIFIPKSIQQAKAKVKLIKSASRVRESQHLSAQDSRRDPNWFRQCPTIPAARLWDEVLSRHSKHDESSEIDPTCCEYRDW